MMITFRIMVLMILALAAVTLPINAMNPRNLEVTTPTTTNHVGSLKLEIKCGHCDYSPPPPPKPSPPPPSPPPPSPPPPEEHCPPPPPPPPEEYCPPPPPPPKEYCPPPPPPPEENCPPPPSPPKNPPSTPCLNSPCLNSPPPPFNVGIDIYGPPSQLYPIMETISAARRSFTMPPLLLVLFGLLLAFW
ncbi:hypothetical protein Hdeb2414_s0054g00755221 [Helianthus debilis subsp. tardiflorus]